VRYKQYGHHADLGKINVFGPTTNGQSGALGIFLYGWNAFGRCFSLNCDHDARRLRDSTHESDRDSAPSRSRDVKKRATQGLLVVDVVGLRHKLRVASNMF
jgi:hypothetical protein